MRITNIRVIDPADGADEIRDIFIKGKKIVSKDEYMRQYKGRDDETIDGSGLIAGPGLVDVHVHFRDTGQTH